MTLPSWMLKLAAAAVIPVLLGVGVAFSAPSPSTSEAVDIDLDYRPGMDGVDFSAVTGGTASAEAVSCETAAWPRIPAECLQGGDPDGDVRRIRITN